MKKAIICLGLGLASVESNQDFLAGIFSGNTGGNSCGTKTGEAYASSNASNVSESYAVDGGVKANNINSFEKTGSKSGTKVSSNSNTATYQKANIDNNNVVKSGTGCGDDLSFSNDYGCNDNCSETKYNVNLPSDSCYGGSAIEEGCGSNDKNTFGVTNTDFGNFANYGANSDNCYADEDHFGKASGVASTLAKSAQTGSTLGGYVFGGNTSGNNVASANAVSNTSAVATSNGNGKAISNAISKTVASAGATGNTAPVIVRQTPVITQQPRVIVQQAPTVQQQPIYVQSGNNQNTVDNSKSTVSANKNAKVAAIRSNAAIGQTKAQNAANKNQQYNAKVNRAATQNNNAAVNKSKNLVNSDDKICNNACLAFNKAGQHRQNLDKDHICHANDQALHKEEHCADEQKFQQEDSGKCKTLECTHIVESVCKDCKTGESAKRQIWTKKKSCAKKSNDKRASAKNMHKACHKNMEKQAFKQAEHTLNLHAVNDMDHNASCDESRLSVSAAQALKDAASSDSDASSCNNASSNQNVQQASSAQSSLDNASSNNVGVQYDTNADVQGTANSYVTRQNDTC